MTTPSTTASSTHRARGEAGRRGDDVRSDVFVSVQLRDSGGIEIQVQSRAEKLFGAAIRSEVERVASTLGMTHALIRVEDMGALPFVIMARAEAAMKRAGLKGSALPSKTAGSHSRSTRDRLRRSRLYLPGNEPKFMVNAGLHRPDAVILDLEDSVHPDHKGAARLVVRNALRCVDFHGCERMVRINPGELGLRDLDDVIPQSPELILIPKAETAHDVRTVDDHIREIQENSGMDEPVWLMPILESARGIENALDIAESSDRVVALTIGLEDYTADLGVRKTSDGAESLYARMRLVNAAAAADIQAIDSVFGDVGDTDGLRTWASRSKALGFEGMGCIHPRQIQPIHDSFAPSAEEIARAMRIVEAFDQARSAGLSVVSLGSRMIDPPVVLRAQRLVETARRAGLLLDSDAKSKPS
jgi:citrate lyase subunit beta/citryl-CoA lyase